MTLCNGLKVFMKLSMPCAKYDIFTMQWTPLRKDTRSMEKEILCMSAHVRRHSARVPLHRQRDGLGLTFQGS